MQADRVRTATTANQHASITEINHRDEGLFCGHYTRSVPFDITCFLWQLNHDSGRLYRSGLRAKHHVQLWAIRVGCCEHCSRRVPFVSTLSSKQQQWKHAQTGKAFKIKVKLFGFFGPPSSPEGRNPSNQRFLVVDSRGT